MSNKNLKHSISINIVFFFLVYIWSITEILGLFKLLTRKGIVISELATVLIAVGIYFFLFRSKIRISHLKDVFYIQLDDNLEKLLFFLCIAFCVVMGAIAIVTPPCNGDSLAYHLPRICNWAQNKSTDYYLVSDVRENVSPVMAEYLTCHLYILCKGDYLTPLVQWASYCYSGYLVYYICRQLNVNKHFSYAGALLFYSMPIAIAESVTTQVDLVSVMVMLMFLSVIYELGTAEENLKLDASSIFNIVLCSGLVGLGFITKNSICFMMIVFLCWLLYKCILRKDSIVTLFVLLLIAVIPVAILTVPTMYRNYTWYGDIFALSYMDGIMIQTKNPKYIFINILKNLSLLYVVGSSARNSLIKHVTNIAEALGVDINDRVISLVDYDLPDFTGRYHHDNASVPLFGVLMVLALVLFIYLLIKKCVNKRAFAFACLLSFLVNIVVIRFQFWGTRLFLPGFGIMCIFITYTSYVFLQKVGEPEKISIISLFVGLCIASAIPAIDYQKQLSDIYFKERNRFRVYFGLADWKYEEYSRMFEFIDIINPTKIGYIDGEASYYLWYRLKNDLRELREIDLDNPLPNFTPECVLVIWKNDFPTEFTYGDTEYYLGWADEMQPEGYRIYFKK